MIIERFDFLYKVIGLDLDNTLTEIDTTLDIISRELSIKNIDVNDVIDYNLFTSFGLVNHEKENSFWLENEREIIENSIFSKDRYESIINNFSNSDTVFHIITNRHNKYRDCTSDWLLRNNIKYDKLVMTGGESKINYIKELKIELMIDDAPKVIEEIYQKGLDKIIDVVKVKYKYNEKLKSKYIMDLSGNLLTNN